MPAFDPRVTPARADLAAKHLEGKVTAARYVEGRVYDVIDPVAPLRREPRPDAPLATEALKGERVTIYDTNEEGWAWGQLAADGYVGWLPANALVPPGAPPTHKVTALRTFAFPGPSIKMPPLEALPLRRAACHRAHGGSHGGDALGRLRAGASPCADRPERKGFRRGGGALRRRAVSVGRQDRLGLDCSGLVQVALTACGVPCPRDSDMQEAALGTPVAAAPDFSNLKRGDLVFWKGHVAIVRDAASLLHANAFHMAVVIEPIVDAIGRIAAAGSEITSVRQMAR